MPFRPVWVVSQVEFEIPRHHHVVHGEDHSSFHVVPRHLKKIIASNVLLSLFPSLLLLSFLFYYTASSFAKRGDHIDSDATSEGIKVKPGQIMLSVMRPVIELPGEGTKIYARTRDRILTSIIPRQEAPRPS
jgi:hypothetical protein